MAGDDAADCVGVERGKEVGREKRKAVLRLPRSNWIKNRVKNRTQKHRGAAPRQVRGDGANAEIGAPGKN